MTTAMLLKYLEFLKIECLRHQEDQYISNDEINQLQIEIKRFLQKVAKGSFPEKVKSEISKIDFDLDDDNHNHRKFKIFRFIGGFQGKEFKEQENRKHRFLKLYNDLDATIFKIKTSF